MQTQGVCFPLECSHVSCAIDSLFGNAIENIITIAVCCVWLIGRSVGCYYNTTTEHILEWFATESILDYLLVRLRNLRRVQIRQTHPWHCCRQKY